MNYTQLREAIEKAPLLYRRDLEELFNLTTIGDDVLPRFKGHLENAETYREFFDAIYADETQKWGSAWAKWVRFAHKRWYDHFEPQIALQNVLLKSDGIPLEFGSGIVLAPTGSRDKVANLLVFKSGAFNVEAADFVTSVGGSFKCCGLEFTGIYGLYSSKGTVVLEEWEAEHEPRPFEEETCCG